MIVFEWWRDFSRTGKYLSGALLIGLSTALALSGTVWFYGWAVGGVLLVCTWLGIGED